MKQEFVSARWLLFDGLHSGRVHFSDRHVALYNTLDYPSYSLAVEKVKAAYRMGYSLLDKIAVFLNHYASLNVNPKNIYFRSIWYEDLNLQKRIVREEFASSKNWPFRGLYWLSKDIFDPELKDVMEPEARSLYEICNHLEHGYLKVHEILLSSGNHASEDAWSDRLAYSVSRSEFQDKTIHVLKLARAGLIYLSLGMFREEQRRDRARNEGLRMPMMLDLWDDDWKI